jgi:hypothetical protein
MVSFKARTLVETPLYAACKETLGVDCERLDEIIEGVTMKMAVEPKYFPIAPGLENVRRARSKEFPPEIPSFRIWFTYDSQRVYLQLIERTPADELPA